MEFSTINTPSKPKFSGTLALTPTSSRRSPSHLLEATTYSPCQCVGAFSRRSGHRLVRSTSCSDDVRRDLPSRFFKQRHIRNSSARLYLHCTLVPRRCREEGFSQRRLQRCLWRGLRERSEGIDARSRHVLNSWPVQGRFSRMFCPFPGLSRYDLGEHTSAIGKC